jgi:hypothetical protein
MKNLNFHKKGSFFDILYLVVFTFVLGLVITIGWVVYSSINAEWQTHAELGTTSKDIMQAGNDKFISVFDGVFLVMLVGLYLGALILAYMVDINPVFFFLSLFMMAVIVIISAAMGNAWYYYANNPTLASYVDDFTIIPFVMGRSVFIFTVMAFGLAGVMYAKSR